MSTAFENDDQREVFNEGLYLYKQTYGGVEIAGLRQDAQTPNQLNVPETLGGEDVVAIGERAFKGRNFVQIALPETLRTIESRAFDSCERLTEVRIPGSVENIEGTAFSSCSSLRTLKFFGKSYSYRFHQNALYSLGDEPSLVCLLPGSTLTELRIPNGIVKIEARSVAYNGWLERVYIPQTVADIDVCAFMGTQRIDRFHVSKNNFYFRSVKGALFAMFMPTLYRYPSARKRETIVVPETVLAIDGGAFSANFNVKRVVLPDTIYSVDDSTFYYCTNLESVRLPSTLREIECYAFGWCKKLANIRIPNAVSTIDAYAFMRTGIESVELPESLTSLGERAFSHCRNLKRVQLPEGLVSVGAGAFERCSSLETIDVPPSVEAIEEDAFPLGARLRVARGSYAEEWARENKRRIC